MRTTIDKQLKLGSAYFKERTKNVFDPLQNISFWNNAIVHWMIISALVLNIAVIILLAFFVHPTEMMIKLQYNVFFGTSLHVQWWQTYALPLIGLAFFAVDLLVANVLYYSKERIAAYILLLGGVFAQIALVVAALSVILNNY
jgi:hypothetical protein